MILLQLLQAVEETQVVDEPRIVDKTMDMAPAKMSLLQLFMANFKTENREKRTFCS
jgi:hypothetical protein